MKIFFLLLGCSLFLFFQNGFAQSSQDVLVKAEGKYFYKNKVYKKKEVGELFKQDEASFFHYKKYRKAHQVFNGSAISTLVLGGGGLLLFLEDKGGNHSEGDACYEICPHQQVGIVMIVASFLTATATIISFPISRKHYKKTIKSFNRDRNSAPAVGSVPLKLDFNYTGNGVGMVLNF